MLQFSSVQSLSCVWLFATPRTAARQASLSISNSWSLLKLMSIESVMSSKHLILCRHPSPPAFNLSQHQGLFQWVSSLHQVAKVLELQLQHQSFQWIFRVDFLLGLTGLILDFLFFAVLYLSSGNTCPQHSNSEAPLILLLSPHHHTSVDHCNPWKAITRKWAGKRFEERFIHSFNKY